MAVVTAIAPSPHPPTGRFGCGTWAAVKPQTLGEHSDKVNAVAVVNGRRAISTSDDRTLRVWDLETGQTLRVFEGHSARVNGVAVVDLQHVVSACNDGTLRLWDLESGVLALLKDIRLSSLRWRLWTPITQFPRPLIEHFGSGT